MIFDSDKVLAHEATLRKYFPALLLRSQKKDYGQIAAELGLPLGTVKSRIHRGTKVLKAALAKKET